MSYQIPTFHHKEVENLYHYDLRIPHEILQSILDLPKDTLTEDLFLVIEDALDNSEYYNKKEYVRADSEMVLHALCILAETRHETALPKLLDLLKTDNFDAWDTFCADFIYEDLWRILYQLSYHDIDAMLSLVCSDEEVNYNFRTLPFHVVSQIALHYPERRDECINWFRSAYEKNILNKTLDTGDDSYDFWGFMAIYLMEMRAVELLPEIRTLFEKEKIDGFFIGDLENLEKRIQSPSNEQNILPLFDDIFSFYEDAATTWHYYDDDAIAKQEIRRAKWAEEEARKEQIRAEKEAKNIPYENENAVYYDMPIIKDNKINRNDPCPCGSGKKYKKCCG